MAVKPFSDEQARALVNLEQRYQVWMEAEQTLQALPYDLRRKLVDGRAYLYEINDRGGNGKSLGPWSPENEAKFSNYHQRKTTAKARRDASRVALDETGRLCRALRAPMLASDAGAILREADRQRLLGSHLLVVGTSAMPAYAVEASGFLPDAPDETDVVEILVAPSRAATMSRLDQPKPVPLPEQEWLLNGRPVDRVVICRDGSPARIVAPDPRWFALQKLWMSRQAKRNPLKRAKDSKQGMAILDAIREAMPQYPLEEAFERSLPEALVEPYQTWKRREADAAKRSW